MPKKYRDRPSLEGNVVINAVETGKLEVKIIDGDIPVLLVRKGFRLRQIWYKKEGDAFKRFSARTWPHKGVFLVPIWQEIDRETYDHYKKINHPVISFEINNRVHILRFMQVDGIIKAIRQQEYVREEYEKKQFSIETVGDELTVIRKIANILFTIKRRSVTLEALKHKFDGGRNVWAMMLEGFVSRSPLFTKKDLRKLSMVCRSIKDIRKKFEDYPFLPVYPKLNLAAKCLDKAISCLERSENPDLTNARRLISRAHFHLESIKQLPG